MHKLSHQERQSLEEQVKRSHDIHEKDRLRVILARDDGLKPEIIAHVLRISERRIFDYLADWQREGKTTHDPKGGKDPKLGEEEEEELIKHLEENTYRRVTDIVLYVEEKFGVKYEQSGMTKWLKRQDFVYKKPKKIPGRVDLKKQEAFIQAYEELKKRITKEEDIYFCDATHPQYQVQEAYGWIRKGQIKTIATTSKQDRLHFAGAICLRNMQTFVKEYPTINADNIVNFLKHLKASSTKKRIHIICDNGTEYNNSSVRCYAKMSNICMHYLPPYSPNLNPIERLWKILREYTCYNRCYKNFLSFKEAICSFLFEKIPKMKNELRKRINDHFERIKINPMKLAIY